MTPSLLSLFLILIFCQAITYFNQFGPKINTNFPMSRCFEQIFEKNEGEKHLFSKKGLSPFNFF